MLDKRSVSHGNLTRNRPIRAIVRRKLKGSLRELQSPTRTSSNSRGADEDSGFGGDSGAELSMESGFTHSNSSMSNHQAPSSFCSPPNSSRSCDASSGTSSSGTSISSSSSSCSSSTSISCASNSSINISGTGSNYSRIVLPRFGVTEEFFVDPSVGIHPKRLRLDMTEEANELPEEEASPPQCPEGGAKIVSFKNVPGLLFPANGVQVQPATLLSISPQQPKQVVVEHLKQKIIATCKVSSKVDKAIKKKTKCHVLEGNLLSMSSDRAYELQLLTQPEGQHRARYQTEGSRGAVKDRAGTGHPTVKLKGYDKDAVLQVFVASDGAHGGSVTPHLFYQACKVSGKNSTPCTEERVHGTTVLEIAMQPDNDMTISCDCVGILKERNVDVEQRVKSFVTRGKKKSTKCRLVFRTKVILSSGVQEILQVVSQPISCTQPPGVPEICRKSRSSCSVEGDKEMFIIGKNFYKDTEVVFREVNDKDEILWSSSVVPEKDFLQSNHLICQIPPYCNTSLSSELEVQVVVVSCNKVSDPHPFTYLPRKKEIKEEINTLQRQIFPKGVSSNAVKLNELYAESGGGLPLSKEYFHFANSSLSTTTSSLPVIGSNTLSVNRERAVIPPVQVNRVLAAVKPQVQTIGSTNPKFSQKNIQCNTFTTATVLTPKPSPNSIPTLVTDSVGGSEVKERENVLENLIQMLRLLKNIPGSLHNPIMELVADEILRQVKKRGGAGGSTVEKDNPVQSSIILPNADSSFLYGLKTTPHEKVSNAKELNFASSTTSTSGNSASKVYPINTFHDIPLQNPAGSPVPTHAFVPVAIQQDKPTQGENTKVVYPIGTNFFSAREIYAVSQNDAPVVHTVCQSTPLVINVTEHQSVLPTKIDYLTSINSSQRIPLEQEPVLKKMDHHEEQMTMLPNNYKIISNIQDHNSTLSLNQVDSFNQGDLKGEGNLLQNERTIAPSSGKDLSLHDATYVLEAPRSSSNLDMALTFKLENSDPLLSQASAMTTMTLQAPVGEHHSAEGAASMISQTINQGGANDVHISNFSESELLDYINPICFDNV